MSQRRSGILLSGSAYAIWGLLPLYLKSVQAVAPLEVVAHRVAWSVVLLGGLLAVRKNWAWLGAALRTRRIVGRFVSTAALLSVNWLLYIWAVNAGRVVDASLGYFINPLLSVVLGVVVLHERQRPLQWAAIGVALFGVIWLSVLAGQLPWIGLVLATTFGLYGLLRKTASLGATEGLALETLLLLPIALVYLGWGFLSGHSGWLHAGPGLRSLLVLAGPITAIPLLLFAAGARRIPLALVGILQYIGPTLQLMLGVFLWREAFAPAKVAGYAFIWLALVLYTTEGVWFARQQPKIVPSSA